MSTQHRSFLLASLLPAFLLVGVFAVVQAQEGRSPSAKPTNWSDPATWPDRKVPAAGDKVTIERGKEVVLNVSPPALNGLTIEGKLSWDANGSPKGDDSLVEWVGGKLLPVYPAAVARHAPTIPKPAWKG